MIDTVHEHEYLIFLFGFNVQFVSNLTCLYSYVLAVWWQVLRVRFMCPKPYFYICVIRITSIIFVEDVQKSFSEATQSSIPEYSGYTPKFAPDRIEAGSRFLLSIENISDTL